MSTPTSVQIVPGNLVLSGNVDTNDTDNTFCIDRANGIVGIGQSLTSLVTGINDSNVLQISGEVTATKFHGDGRGITGLTDSKWLEDDNDVNNIHYSLGNVKIGAGTSNANLDVVGSARVSNAVTIGTTKTYVVTVQQVDNVNKYFIDGVDRPSLELHEHQTYLFDLTAPGVGHPFRLAMEANGGGGQPLGSLPASDYTTGTDYTSVANHLKFTVPSGAPSTLYYYCTQHSGMGGTVSISSEAELIVSGRIESTGTRGVSLGGGTTTQRPTYAPLGTMRYNSTIGLMEAYTASGWGALTSPASIESVSPASVLLADTATQVFTVTGTGIGIGSTVQLEGANGSLYSVVDATPPNAAGTQVTFKMGSFTGVSSEFPPSAMTSDTSIEGYTVSSDYPQNPYLAFNDSTSDWWYSGTQAYLTNSPFLASSSVGVTQDISGTSHRGHWIQLQIPSSVILTRTILGNPNEDRAYGQFVILGSNDGTYWTLLHSGNGVVNTQSTDVTTLSAGSAEAFSYFRIVITSKRGGNGNGQIQINNIQFFGGNGASWDLAQRPYKVKITGGSGLATTSTQTINIGDYLAYPFSPNPFTFTNAGEVGRLGPTFADMKSVYGASGWWQNTENFNEISGKQGFQLWTVPQTTTYRITANGARGGTTNVSSGDLNYPGAGAQIRADFALTKGTKLVIIVGQSARTAEQNDGEAAGGGGGATWVLKENFTTSTNDIYMVAGGGAGQANNEHTNHTAASGGTSQASISDTGGGETSQGDTLRNAGGGAGWGSNGIGGGFTGAADNGGDTFGSKPASGATGGNYTYGTPNWDGQGGFGGGGSSSIQIPGGGGGLSGGNAAYNEAASGGWGHAQGGTSYIMPNATGGVTVTNRVFVGTNSYIDGSVVIELL